MESKRRITVSKPLPVPEAPTFHKVEGETEDQKSKRIESKYIARAVTPLRAIRAMCVQCTGIQPRRIAECTATGCALHPFRMETNPFHSKSKKRIPKVRVK